MGIISRFMDIMSANINAMLDKAEDPAKMIDQYLRNLERDLQNVKDETATVMAEEKRAKRELDAAQAEADKYQRYAQRAVAAGNDADAKAFLIQKKTASEKVATLQAAYDAAVSNSQKMQQMHTKLAADIVTLNSRKEAIKAKAAIARAQEKVNKVGSSLEGVAEHLSQVQKMEERANQMLDKAEAMAQLNQRQIDSNLEELELKYDLASMAHDDVDDELAALKAQMGMTSES